jgi:Mg2+ and Co2+ transporter CorA
MTAIDLHSSVPDHGPSAGDQGSADKPSRRSRAKASLDADAAPEHFRVRRFDSDRTDEELTFDEAIASKPSRRQLLWIDIAGDLTSGEAETLAGRFKLDPRTRRALQVASDHPHLALSSGYFHIRVAAEPDYSNPAETNWLDIIAGRNVVISQHRAPIGFLDDLDERIEGDATLGNLDSATFVASMLDSTVTSYFNVADAIDDVVDQFDERSLGDDDRRELLVDLVAVRRRIAMLRRVLTEHRQVFAWLAAADLAQIVGPDSAAGFQSVAARFEGAVAAVEASRDLLLGSFDVYMTRTAQRTNDIMKVLALVTVLLLPGALVAGLLGMNVDVPLAKDDPLSFWIVIGGVLLFIVALLVAARWRRWL